MPKFSKRHYEVIASLVKTWQRDNTSVDNIQADLAEVFMQDNPRFDIVRFNKACEP